MCQRISEYQNIKKYTAGIYIHHVSHTLVTSSNPFFHISLGQKHTVALKITILQV